MELQECLPYKEGIKYLTKTFSPLLKLQYSVVVHINHLCFDRGSGYDMSAILRDAALAAKWTEPPKDALDTLVLKSVDYSQLDRFTQVAFEIKILNSLQMDYSG